MAAHTSRRIGVLAALGIGLGGFGLLVGAGLSAGSDPAPDLTTLLPTDRPGWPHARWMDTVEAPGHVLYRFDSVIFNKGGALDVSRSSESGPTCQTIWSDSGGVPTNNLADPGPCTKNLDGNKIAYSSIRGHNHFHTQLVAAYELDTTDGALVSKAAKNTAGFCLYDSWTQDASDYFASGEICHPGEQDYPGAVREGISRNVGDFYGSELGDQWVDVTGVAPGTYRLRAEANPARIYIESDYTNNVETADVQIPGATATDVQGSVAPGGSIDIPISGQVVFPDVPSRTPGCPVVNEVPQVEKDSSCTTTALAGKLTFQLGAAKVGTAKITSSAGLGATVHYTAPAGFNGVDTFTYTAADSRGLVSRPATVTVTVGTGGTTGSTGTGGGTGGATSVKTTVKLKPSFRLLHSRGRAFLAVKGTLPRSQAGRLVKIQRKLGRKVRVIGVVRVAKTGRYRRAILVHASTLSVRASLGSNATTKAALSPFRRVTG